VDFFGRSVELKITRQSELPPTPPGDHTQRVPGKYSGVTCGFGAGIQASVGGVDSKKWT